jgi:hypothetical protein
VLGDLEADSTRKALADALWDALDELAADPGARAVRHRRYQVGAWGIVVRARNDDDHLILWQPGPAEDEVTVVYVGPDI